MKSVKGISHNCSINFNVSGHVLYNSQKLFSIFIWNKVKPGGNVWTQFFKYLILADCKKHPYFKIGWTILNPHNLHLKDCSNREGGYRLANDPLVKGSLGKRPEPPFWILNYHLSQYTLCNRHHCFCLIMYETQVLGIWFLHLSSLMRWFSYAMMGFTSFHHRGALSWATQPKQFERKSHTWLCPPLGGVVLGLPWTAPF